MTEFILTASIVTTIVITFVPVFVGSAAKAKKDARPESDVTFSLGHYPTSFCRITNVVLDTREKVFKYKQPENGNSLKKTCLFTDDIWPFVNVVSSNASLPACDVVYNKGYVFTMYYYYGSNYFHLHYDTMLPLFSAVHQWPQGQVKDVVFMPSVESKRLQVGLYIKKIKMIHSTHCY